ncbi:ornithine decarboxylase [Trichonephila clavipes]|nr:ornithine decarboxylase [Trichonephila clavipes]
MGEKTNRERAKWPWETKDVWDKIDTAKIIEFPNEKLRSKVVLQSAIDEFFPPESEVDIISEPGRYFVTSAFTFFGSIIGKKEILVREPNIMYFVNEGIYGLFVHKIFYNVHITATPVKEYAPDSLKLCCIAGQTCDPLDILVESCMLPELEVGDWLMFPNMGAYTSACSTQFNGFEKTGVKYIVSEETLSYLEKFPAGMKLCSFLKGKSVVLEKSNLLTK